MQFNELVVAIVSVSVTGSVIKTYIAYKLKMAEVKAERATAPDTALRQEMAELKQKMNELRDVTTQYDMSFDSALHRVESRLSNMEHRLGEVESQSSVTHTTR